MKVTPVPLLIRLPSSLPAASLEATGWEADEPDAELRLRSAEETSAVPVDGPAAGAGPADVPVSDAVAGPLVGAGVCGAAVEAAGVELPFTIDGWLPEGEPVVAGAVVLGVVDFTTAGAVVVVVIDWSTDSDTFEPPLPMSGTVVVGAGATVVAVVTGAAVVGVVVADAAVPADTVVGVPAGVP